MDRPSINAAAAPRLRLAVGFRSDTGRARERNEDALAVFLPYGDEPNPASVDALFLVADGMGGHEAGDVASRFAARRIAGALTGPKAVPAAVDEESLEPRLDSLLQAANRELVELAASEGLTRGLGTTLTAAVLRGTTLYLAHVGDSRCYRLREGALAQLTEDHSWVAEQRRTGLLTAEEAEAHPQRNILTQCLGLDRKLDVFHRAAEVAAGDRYLLCSDGLHGPVPDRVLARVLETEASPQAAAQRLIDLANEAGGEDNITAIVADVAPAGPPATDTIPGELSPLAVTAERAAPRGAANRGARALVAIGTLLVLAALAAGAMLLGPAGLRRPPARAPSAAAGLPAGDTAAVPAATDTPTTVRSDSSSPPPQE
jgi:protein phosphatase